MFSTSNLIQWSFGGGGLLYITLFSLSSHSKGFPVTSLRRTKFSYIYRLVYSKIHGPKLIFATWSHHPKCQSRWNTCKLPLFRSLISQFFVRWTYQDKAWDVPCLKTGPLRVCWPDRFWATPLVCKSKNSTLKIGLKSVPSFTDQTHIILTYCIPVRLSGGGPRVVVSTAAFHAGVRGSFPGLGGLKETNILLPHPHVKPWGASVTES